MSNSEIGTTLLHLRDSDDQDHQRLICGFLHSSSESCRCNWLRVDFRVFHENMMKYFDSASIYPTQREREIGPCTVPTSWYPGLMHTSLRGQVAN